MIVTKEKFFLKFWSYKKACWLKMLNKEQCTWFLDVAGLMRALGKCCPLSLTESWAPTDWRHAPDQKSSQTPRLMSIDS